MGVRDMFHYVMAGLFFLAAAIAAQAQISQPSSVLDGSGTVAAGGTLANVSAAGQSGGIAVSSGGGYVNYAGFLTTFMLKPGLDTDGDGLADEVDADNDNDQLADADEIGGGGFSPVTPTLVNLADTDGDGQFDGWESVAGTDPTNSNAMLELVAISNDPSGRSVAWFARGNHERTYLVRATTNARQPYATVLFSNTVAGGVAPWFAITTAITHASASNTLFYAVQVLP